MGKAVNVTPSEQRRFAEAVAIANIPTLLMVLVQLTGDERWLEAPFRPVRLRGMGDNDSGGLPEAAQNEVRAAALDAILAWRGGQPVVMPEPSADTLVRMLSVAMAENVPGEYGPGIRHRTYKSKHKATANLETAAYQLPLKGQLV